MKIFVALIFTLVHIPAIFLRLSPFKDIINKKQKRTLMIIYIGTMIINFICWTCVFFDNRMTPGLYKLGLFVFSMWLTFVNIFVIKGKYQEHLFASGVEFLLGQLLIVIGDYVMQFIPITDLHMSILVHMSMVATVYALVYVIFKKLLVTTIAPFLSLEVESYWKTIWMIPFAIYFATTIAYPADDPVTSILEVFAQILIVTATVMMCKSVASDSGRMKERLAITEEIGIQKAYYQALSGKVIEMQRIRHDYKHHGDAIRYYIDKNDKDGLMEYCSNIFKNIETSNIHYSGDSVVDALIYRYKEIADKNRIDFKVVGSFSDVQIKETDLCVLIGNALDNAVAGCLTIKNNRSIKVSIRKDNGAFAILVQNTFDGVIKKENNKFISRKRKNQAGIGFESMKSICEKYGGEVQTRYDESTFSLMFYNL